MAGKPRLMVPPLSERRLVVRLVPWPSEAHRQRGMDTLNEFIASGRRKMAEEARQQQPSQPLPRGKTA